VAKLFLPAKTFCHAGIFHGTNRFLSTSRQNLPALAVRAIKLCLRVCVFFSDNDDVSEADDDDDERLVVA